MKKINFGFLSFMLVFSCLVVLLGKPGISLAAPNFQVPFPCKQTWKGETRKNHNPKQSIDFMRKNGNRDTVVASASGKVKKVGSLGSRSYGKYVYIDHGNGWETRYAHLSKISVKKGQKIKSGQKIGNVGSSGNSSAPHLHFEEKHNGKAKPVYFGSKKAYYYGSKNYKSSNQCSSKKKTDPVKPKRDNSFYKKPQAADAVQSKHTKFFHCQEKDYDVKNPYLDDKLWNEYISSFYDYFGSEDQIATTCK